MANPRCHNFDDDFILSGFPKRHVFNGPFALGERPSRDESLRLHYLIPSSTSMRNWTLWKPWRVSLDKSSGVLLLRGILRSRSLRPVACDAVVGLSLICGSVRAWSKCGDARSPRRRPDVPGFGHLSLLGPLASQLQIPQET